MNYTARWMVLVLVAASVFGALSTQVCAQSAEQIDLVRAALPSQARVAPETPRKLLIFNLCNGYQHEAVELGAKTLEMLGATTGAYTSVLSDDIAMFEPENLKQFDAVCFNNTTGSLFLPKNIDELSAEAQEAARAYDAALKQSLLDFVRSGKGIVGVHAATDTFYEWADYGEMMGGYFSGHPWNEEVGVQVDDPLNALSAAFDAPTFTIADEIYQFRAPYSREKLRVLLSLDVSKTNMDKGDAINRTDGDFAVAWIRSYGAGRVFYCSLGHRPEVFMDPMVLQFYLDGVQFALGDLEADTLPSAALPDAYVKQAEEARQALAMDQILRDVSTMDYGDGEALPLALEAQVRNVERNSEKGAALAARLADALKQKGVTPAGKRFLAEQLSLCATEKEIGVLVDMLNDDACADIGRYGLERIPGESIDEALCAALKDANETQQIGILNTLGRRGNPRVIPEVARLMQSTASPEVAHAAAAALGKIGGRKAIRALQQVDYTSDPEFGDAYLVACGQLLKEGETRRAARHYKDLLKHSSVPMVRWAAFVGMVTARGTKAVPAITDAFEQDDVELQHAATHCVREIGGTQDTQAFASRLPNLAPKAQVMLIAALSDRGDAAASDSVLAMLDSPDAEVQLAAVKALAYLGDASAVMPLARVAATAKGNTRDEARKSLALLQGANLDEEIVSNIPNAEAAVSAELIRSTVPRYTLDAVPALLAAARAEDPGVRTEAYKALAILAEPAQLPELLALLTQLEGEKGRKEAEKTVGIVARKIVPEEAQAEPVLALLPNVSEASARISLLNVLGIIGGADALEAVREALADSDASVREGAVRALTAWPDSAPLEDLLALSATATTETLRVLSLRAALRMLEQDNILSGKPTFMQTRSINEDLALYKRAMALATRPEEKKLVLAGLVSVPMPATTEFVKTFTSDPELRVEAEQALDKLSQAGVQAWASHNAEAAYKALDGVPSVYWDTQTTQMPGMWFMADLGREQTVKELTLRAQDWNHVNEYAVYLSSDQKEWGAPVASGTGEAVTTIQFAPRKARFIAIEQTGPSSHNWWTIEEMEID